MRSVWLGGGLEGRLDFSKHLSFIFLCGLSLRIKAVKACAVLPAATGSIPSAHREPSLELRSCTLKVAWCRTDDDFGVPGASPDEAEL